MACSLVLRPSSELHCTALFPPPLCSLAIKNDLKMQNAKKKKKKMRALSIAIVQQTTPQGGGASAVYAKEMERLSAKDSLLLAFKDAGGFEALVTGRITEMQRIDVNETIIGLERLNPTPRPTMSPFLKGHWNFEWFGAGRPGLFAARLLLKRFPPTLANLSKLDVLIKDGYANISANVKLLNSIESIFILSTRLSVEGPLRMKEEYIEGTLQSPKIREETIPEQLKGSFGQAVNALQQLPVPISNAVTNGLKVPLGGAFQRLFMISYLDEQILIIRDSAGVAEVLTRLDPVSSPMEDTIPQFET